MNIHHGHVLDILPTLDAGSVQCCVTSPPYWGLRDYSIDPVAWGGEPGCVHQWNEPAVGGEGYSSGQRKRWQHGNTRKDDPAGWEKLVAQGCLCRKCGAWLGSLGLEPTPELYVEHLVAVFRAVRRVLRDDGTLWLNLGDSYTSGGRPDRDTSLVSRTSGVTNRSAGMDRPQTPAGLKPKDLVGIPWRVAFALQADGWWLRSDIIWSKPNPMPESVRDRPTRAHEYIFLLSKSARYFYDADAIAEPGTVPAGTRAARGSEERAAVPGVNARPPEYKVYTGQRNKRSVWSITTAPFPEAHFATFPPKLPELCIKAGSAEQACPECGAPWERVVERTCKASAPRGTVPSSGRANLQGPQQGALSCTSRTLGWQPACECGHDETVGSVVLDPFIGSGTVGLVAEKLGRRWVGIDANAEYLEIARRRLAQPTLWTPEEER